MRLPPPPAVIDSRSESAVERIEILEAFIDLPEVRRAAGQRHHMAPWWCRKLLKPLI